MIYKNLILVLKQKSEEVTFPLSEDDITTINNMIMYLRISQDEEYAEEIATTVMNWRKKSAVYQVR